MILILPGMLRSEFLYSRLLSACSGEEPTGDVVMTRKNRRRAKENRGIFRKNGEETRRNRAFSELVCSTCHCPTPLRLEVSERRERGLGWLKAVLM